jgi:hypothetical protein
LGWVWVVEKVKNFFVCSLFPKTFGKVWFGQARLAWTRNKKKIFKKTLKRKVKNKAINPRVGAVLNLVLYVFPR